MRRFIAAIAIAALAVVSLSPAALAEDRLVIASTTSTDNTGLFGALIPAYQAWTKLDDVRVDVVAVGTGKAIEIARRGDADMLLVHDREREEKFVSEGWGIKRVEVMYNDFVVIGPHTDPAGVSDAGSAAAAFRLIADKDAAFVSRGDDSGTHAREKKLWAEAGVDVTKLTKFYSVGQGMAETLRVADEKSAYTISDRATYNTYRPSLKNIATMFQGDPMLFNQYAAIAVNPEKHPHVKILLANDFIDFLVSQEGQELIAGFKDKAGGTLFVPNAAK